jgi:hypothetical protein
MITNDEELINSIKANNIQEVVEWVENGGNPFKAIKIKKIILQKEDLGWCEGDDTEDVYREETMTVLDYIEMLNAEQLHTEVINKAEPTSILMWAAMKDKSHLFKSCLQRGADVNKTVINLAILKQENAFKQLLNLGIDKQLILNEALKQNLLPLIECLVSNTEDMQNALIHWFNNNNNHEIKNISEKKPDLFCEALNKLLIDGVITKQDDLDKIFKLIPNNVFIKNLYTGAGYVYDLLTSAAQSKNISLFKYYIESKSFYGKSLIDAAFKAKHKEIYELFIGSSYEQDLLWQLTYYKDSYNDLKHLMEKGCDIDYIFSKISFFDRRIKEFNDLIKFAKEKNLTDKIDFVKLLLNAVSNSMVSVITTCKKIGIDLNKIVNNDGDNLIKYALVHGIKSPNDVEKIKIIKNLMGNGVTIDKVYSSNESVMSFLIDAIQDDLIKLFLDNQINLNLYNVKESDPLKPINYIIKNLNKNPELYKLLDLFIAHGANINDFDANNMTPLMYALEIKDRTLGIKVVNKLNEKGLIVGNMDQIKAALLKAIDIGYDIVAIDLLEKGIDPNSHDEKGYALKRAEERSTALIKKLLEKGADFVKAFGNEKGLLDINYIIKNVEKKPLLLRLMDLFIKHGANINDFDEHNMTPLMYALEIKNHSLGLKVFNKLIEKGLKKENTDQIKAAFLKAIDTGYDNIAILLLKRGIDPNSHDEKGYALNRIKASSSTQLISKLFQKGADPVKAYGNEEGLFYVIENAKFLKYDWQIIDKLIESNINFNIEKKCNIEGKEIIVTPLTLAMSKGNFQLFKKIILQGKLDKNQLNHYYDSLNLLDNFKELKEFADGVNGFIRINPLNQVEIEKFYSGLVNKWGFCFKSFLARSIQKGIIINERGDELSKLIIKHINYFGTLADFSIEKYKEYILNSLNILKIYIFKPNVEIQDHYKNIIDAVEKQLTNNIDRIDTETKDLELHLVSLFDPEFLEIIKDNSKGPNEPSWSITTNPKNSILGLIGKREYNSDKSEHNGGEALGEGKILRKFLAKILAQEVDINIRLAFADITSLDDLKNNYIDKIKSLFPNGYFAAFDKFYFEMVKFLRDPLHGFIQDIYSENQEHKKIIEEKDAKIKELEEQLKKYADLASSNKRKEPDVNDGEEAPNKKNKKDKDESSKDIDENEAPMEDDTDISISESVPHNTQVGLETTDPFWVNISGASAEMDPS